jgi:hypothetical protein
MALPALRLQLPLLLLLLACKADDDLSEGRGYACDVRQTDLVGPPQCAEGWRCGAAGRCVEDVPGERSSCVRDDECPPGFGCGRDFQCRDLAVNAAYACVEDADCRPSWRCGVAGRCVDPALEALPAEAPGAALEAGARLSPAHLTPPDQLSVSRRFTSEGETVVQARGARLDAYAVRGASETQGALLAQGPFLPPRQVRATLPAAPLALAAQHPTAALALLPDGLHLLAPDGGVSLLEGRLAGMERLASVPTFAGGSGESPARVAAWRAGGPGVEGAVGAGVVSGGTFTPYALAADGGLLAEAPSGGAAALREVTLYAPSVFDVPALVAATDRGLYVRALDAGAPWQPVAAGRLSHAECGDGAGDLVPADVMGGLSSGPLHVVARTRDGGGEAYGLRFATVDAGTPAALPCGAPRGGVALGLAAGPCPLCPAGARLVDARPALGGLEARCALAAGGEQTYALRTEGGCGLAEAPQPLGAAAPTTHWRALREVPASATGDGRLYGGGPPALPLLLPRPPVDLLRVRGVLTASALEPQPSGEQPFEYVQVEGFGLARTGLFGGTATRPLPAGDAVEPRFVVDGRGRVVREARGWEDGGTPPPVAALDVSVSGELRQPATVHAAALPDGGTTLVVSSFDVLLSADLPAGGAGEGPLPTLTTRLAPTPRVPLRDVALLPAPTPPLLLEGYALSDAAVTYFRAPSAQRWEERRMEMPAGDWLALWTLGGRAWVGYRDGRVFSLPARLQVAPALEGGAVVHAFAPLCGRLYAATTRGLLRLAPGGAGAWAPEPRFAELLPSPHPDELAAARLFTGPGELFWAGGRGTLLRFTAGSPCPP